MKKGHLIKNLLHASGFHRFLEMQVRSINRDLTELLIKSFNMTTRKFDINGYSLSIEADDVARVYGLPSSGKVVNSRRWPYKFVEIFCSQINMNRNEVESLTFKKLNDMLALMVDEMAFANMYILLCLSELLTPSNAAIVKFEYGEYLKGTFKEVSKFNWSKHVVDSLLDGLVEWEHSGKMQYPPADMNFLVASFCFIFHACFPEHPRKSTVDLIYCSLILP
ncbi:hypothetical protein LINGRAPRIM_LOCUS2618 [Linum grandiflorum]